jgi:hypothetical protein
VHLDCESQEGLAALRAIRMLSGDGGVLSEVLLLVALAGDGARDLWTDVGTRDGSKA